MIFKVDHLVHFTNSPELASQKMTELGFHAVMGGHHETWGTYNAICHFGLPYIEFLGLENLQIAETVTDNTLIRQVVDEHKQKGDGFYRLALRTDNIEAARQHFKSLGLKTVGPVEGGRRRDDGTLLRWAMLFIENEGENPYNFPFIIDWKVTDNERFLSLRELGMITPESPAQITEIGIGTKDPERTLISWSKAFQLSIDPIHGSNPVNINHWTGRLGDISFVFHETQTDITRPTFLKLAPSSIESKLDIMGGTYLFNS